MRSFTARFRIQEISLAECQACLTPSLVVDFNPVCVCFSFPHPGDLKEMVMEKPSPLLVGREFVRQYYTLLNKAPDYLHR